MTETKLRIVFFGSPEFAVPSLRGLVDAPWCDVALVVSQAAKGVSPIERAAAELGLAVYKPSTLRDADARAPLKAAAADLFVVAAFGLILRRRTLAIPRLGSINVHPSLLPRYRGAIPIPAAIAMGDDETGVSLMVMDEGVDTGAVISRRSAPIMPNDTSESLARRLADVGADQLVHDLPLWAEGALVAEPQPELGATQTRPLTKADGWMDWSLPATTLERHARAMWPWPRAWTTTDGERLQIHEAVAHAQESGLPGEVAPDRRRLLVSTGAGVLELLTVEPAGRRVMSAAAFLNGRRQPLLRLGDGGDPGHRPPFVVPAPPRGGGSEGESAICG